ncbi:MAG: hypothetical protein ABIP94_06260 [Planctomycetota bacterium]
MVVSLLALALTIYLALYGGPLTAVQRWLHAKAAVLSLLVAFVGLHLFVLP